jgi:hypothetical protein
LQNFYTNGTSTDAQIWLRGTTNNIAKEYLMAYDGVNGMEFRNVGYLATKFSQQNGTINALSLDTTGLMTLIAPPALGYTSVPTLVASQIGFISQATGGVASITTTLSSNLCSITLAMGVYLFSYMATIGTASAGNLALSLYANGITITNSGFYITPSNTVMNSGSLTFIATNTANSTVYSIKAITSTGTISISNSLLQAVRIA